MSAGVPIPPRSREGFPQPRRRTKQEVSDAFIARLQARGDVDVSSPGFIESICQHFERLPTRYALDINLDSLDVLSHKRLLDEARADPVTVSFAVRPVEVLCGGGGGGGAASAAAATAAGASARDPAFASPAFADVSFFCWLCCCLFFRAPGKAVEEPLAVPGKKKGGARGRETERASSSAVVFVDEAAAARRLRRARIAQPPR